MKEKYYWNGPYNSSHITAFYQKDAMFALKKNLILFICFLSGLSVLCACGSDEELL